MAWIVEIKDVKTECKDEEQAKRFAELHRPAYEPIIYEEEDDVN